MTGRAAAPAPPRTRVFLVGYYGVPNLGDEAIRTAIERAADLLGVDIVGFVARSPMDDPRAVAAGLRGLPGQLRAIRHADRVVLGGGGILKDEGLRLPAELLVTALLARLHGRRLTLLGVGVGPFYHRVGRVLVAAVARLAQVRTVRDEESARLLRSLRVGRVLVGADPIFSTDSGPDGHRAHGAPSATDHPTSATSGPSRALVSVRPWFPTLPAGEQATRQQALRAAIVDGLRPLVGAGWVLRLVALYRPRDVEESGHLAAAFDAAPGIVSTPAPNDEALDWPALASAVAGADLVVAMRYHAIAAAALADRPIIAIAYEPKVAALAADLGIPAVAVDDPALGTLLAARTEAIARGLPPLGPDAAAVDRLRQRAWSALRASLLD